MMLYYSISGLVNGISCLALGIFVLLNNRKRILNQIYFLYALFIAAWSSGYYFWPNAENRAMALVAFRVLHIGAVFIPVCWYQFVSALTNKLNENKLPISIGYGLSSFFLISIPTKYFIKDVGPSFCFRFWGIPGILYIFYLIYFFLYVYLAILILIKAYQRPDGQHRKQQYMYVLIATIIGYLGGATNFPLYYGIPIYPIGNSLISLYVATIAYTIIRHQLMDIEIIIKKTLVFAGLFAAVYVVFAFFTLLGQLFFEKFFTANRWIAMLPSVVIVTMMLRPLENFLLIITNKFLFQKKFDYKELLKTFTAEVLTVLDLDRLVHLTVDKLVDIIKLNSCAVLLFDDEKQQFEVTASHNLKDSQITLIRPDGIVTFLEQTHGYLLKKELRQKKIFIPDSIQEIIDKLNAELIIPMVLHQKVIGILSLGTKKSDEDYTQDDLDILLPLARTLAIAISNAELFVELGKTQAEAAQREKMAVIGTLSAGINHEICNPLGIARGQCEAFLLNIKDGLYKSKTTEELLEKAKEIMAKVIRETDRATAITKKLSNFAKPSKGEAEIVSVDNELLEVISLVGYELKLEKIEFEKHIDPDLPNIFVDRKQFQEVLFNLIRNAGQAIPDKGKITVTAKADNHKIHIDIQDTGAGIPEDKIRELFSPFFTTKAPGEGTGLGLFIVRQVVEKNGGRIHLKKTKEGEGTTFSLEFPVAAKVVK